MSKRNRTRKQNIEIPSRFILLMLALFCFVMMILSYFTDIFSGSLRFVADYTVVPFQNGIEKVGTWMSLRSDDIKKMQELTAENDELKALVDELTIKNSELMQDKYELSELRALYELDDNYSEYEKIGARVIGRDTGNWFNTFVIDKGIEEGIVVDMNVMAGSGLVGIVTDVGPHSATVKSIIDDDSNVSAMIQNTSDILVVEGDLTLMSDGLLKFSQLEDPDDNVHKGDQIVTSYISSKYLPGILIGYVTEVDMDPNNLTKSGFLTPVVDFKHLSNVLVITELKQQKDS